MITDVSLETNHDNFKYVNGSVLCLITQKIGKRKKYSYTEAFSNIFLDLCLIYFCNVIKTVQGNTAITELYEVINYMKTVDML